MKTPQSFGVHFTVRTDKVKADKVPVYARITVNGHRISMALKRTVDLHSWDVSRGYAKGIRAEVKALNTYLEEIRLALGNCYQNLVLKGKMVSAEMVKESFLGTSDEVHSLNELFNYHNDSAAATLKWSTLKHYYVTQRYLVKFLQVQHKSSDIYLHEINYKFIQDFETYLRNYKPKDHQKPLNNNGVMKHIIRLKKMVHLAIRLEWITKDPE